MREVQEIEKLVKRFGLQPHPEGGYYRETYRSAHQVSGSHHPEPRSAATAIYYLLANHAYSAWHRIDADELWHFYAGRPLLIHVLGTDGLQTHRLGNPLDDESASFQAVVPAGCWFAAELADADSYALVGCTVAPGFEFSRFQLADRETLHRDYPNYAGLINRLSPKT